MQSSFSDLWNDIFTRSLRSASRRDNGRAKNLSLAAVLVALVSGLVVAVVYGLVGEWQREAESAAVDRLKLIAAERADIAARQWESLVAPVERVAGSDFVAAYLVDAVTSADKGADWEAARQGYVRALIEDVGKENDLPGLVVADAAGRGRATYDPAPGRPTTAALLKPSRAENGSAGSPAPAYRRWNGRSYVAHRASVLRSQAEDDAAVGSVSGWVPVDGLIGAVTADVPSPFSRVRVALQIHEAEVPGNSAAAGAQGREMLEASHKLVEGPFVVVARETTTSALADSRKAAGLAWTAAGLMILAAVGGLAAVWYRMRTLQATALAEQEAAFSAELRAQYRLFQTVTSALPALVGLQRRDGTFVFANPALESIAGRDRAAGAGRTYSGFQPFPRAVAARIADLRGRVFDGDDEPTTLVQLDEAGETRDYRLQFRSCDLGAVSEPGVVMVGTDVTPLLAEERRRRADLERTVAALAAAVETIDPHLAGHSQRVETLAVAVADRLALADDARPTVQLAAQVSQIGKLGVDRDLVAAEHRHSDSERQAMRQHIANADRILARIDFRLPVRETVVQMHERLDGSGYPEGVAGDQILLTARVLGAVDVFCARTAPRSYRPGISAGEALEVLRGHPERYDSRVVEALANVVDGTNQRVDA